MSETVTSDAEPATSTKAAAAEPIPAPEDERAAYETPSVDTADEGGAVEDPARVESPAVDAAVAEPPADGADLFETPTAEAPPAAEPPVAETPVAEPPADETPATTGDRYQLVPIDAAPRPESPATMPEEPATTAESLFDEEPAAPAEQPSASTEEPAAPADNAGSVLEDVFGNTPEAAAAASTSPVEPAAEPAAPAGTPAAEPPAEEAPADETPAGTPDAEDLFEDFSHEAPAIDEPSAVVSLESRVWTDASGEHQVEATLTDIVADGVVLSLTTGETVEVPFQSLSVDDLEFVRVQIAIRREALARVGETVASADAR